METFVTIIDFLILGLILAAPILLLVVLRKSNIKYFCVYYFLVGLLILGGTMCFFAWWTDKSDHILMEYYGYNFHGMNEHESYEKVLSENIERVKNMETSIMGIGWSLKAIFGFVIFVPYLVVVYVGNKFLSGR